MSTEAIRLSELANRVKAVLSASFTEPLWVVAEIQEMQVNRAGHCYLELVEKAENSDKLTAKIRATIWSYTFRILRPYFESTTGYRLDSGIKAMLKVSIVYHELYGFSLNVTDIDPNYTLGDIARRRQEVIRQLEEDGVIGLNHELELPEIVQRVAVISSPSAAGYGDFHDQLHHNEHGFVFYTALFSATMQGDGTEASVIAALERIYEHEDHFDAVVIIRGGGSRSDLAAFDTYDLAYNIAQFPLPILSGIGHDRDESVVDLVAHRSLKTPTAVAEFLIDCVHSVASEVELREQELRTLAQEFVDLQKERVERAMTNLVPLVHLQLNKAKHQIETQKNSLKHATESILKQHKTQTERTAQRLQLCTNTRLAKEKGRISQLVYQLKNGSSSFIQKERNRVDIMANSIKHLDPQRLLDRGFSITFFEEKPLCSIKTAKKGKIIVTRLGDGEIQSEIL